MAHAPRRLQERIDYESDLADELVDLRYRLEDMPFEARTGNEHEYRMTQIQDEFQRRPPYVEENGVWRRQAEGVHHLTLAERVVNKEPVRPMFIDGVCTPGTDLVPTFIIPAEVRLGPRASLTSGEEWFKRKWKNRFPAPKYEVRDFKRIKTKDWPQWINHKYALDLRRFVKVILNQASVGSCGAEGTAGAAHCKAAASSVISEGKPFDVAPQPYFLYQVTSGGYDGGSNPADNIALIQRLGCCTQAVRPRSVGWRRGHTAEELADAALHQTLLAASFPTSDIELLGTMLLNGHPVAAGYSGHWWYMVGLLSASMGIWVNSWGAGWGENGMSTISFSRLRYMLGAFLTVEDASQLTY